MDNIAPALIAFTSAVLVGFFGHFFVEDYRRFRDSKAIAAALAGELGSIMSSLSNLQISLEGMSALLARNALLEKTEPLELHEMPNQPSPIFEANAEKIGLLGTKLARGVAYTYDQIRTFRTLFQLISKHHTERSTQWSLDLVNACRKLIDEDNQSKAAVLVEDLDNHSEASYPRSNPIGVASITCITLLSLIFLFGAAYSLLNGAANPRPTSVQFTQFCIQHIYTDTFWNH
ncbi:hypothetical protein [Pseudomonas sp. MWU16-30322]|uniref:hypothetical protein n=1 Tax=Pseudomonas sp. MWU16-30322 TaxID=2878092 RepID=UPI001CFAD275|nr:hypothetical protein [Pseudomonas sp. MWU16-30322]